jgi:hypothetical protein
MSEQGAALLEAAIRQHCKALRLPTVASQFLRLAQQAVKANMSHIEYLEATHSGRRAGRARATDGAAPVAGGSSSAAENAR